MLMSVQMSSKNETWKKKTGPRQLDNELDTEVMDLEPTSQQQKRQMLDLIPHGFPMHHCKQNTKL